MATKVTSAAKFDVKKFNGMNNFNMWRIKMHTLLVQQGLFKALKGVHNLSKEINDEEKKDLMERACSAVQLFLFDLILREVAKETIAARLWTKLESLYMTKSLINQLYLKLGLYTLQIKEGMHIKDHLDEFN